jgi:hypothetical protein
MRLAAALLGILLLISAALPSGALLGPYLPQTVNGGPLIDVSLFGNRELYPGQTTSIQIVVQNGGIMQSYVGYQTPKPYPVTISASSSSTTYPGGSGNNSSNSSSVSSASLTGMGGIPSGYGLQALSTSSLSMSETFVPPYDDFQVNTGQNLDIAVTTALGVTARLSPGGAPIDIVSSDCVVGGSLPAGSVSPPFTYIVRVARGARPGVYALPVTITYKNLAGTYDMTSAFGSFASYNNYAECSVTGYVYVVIREAFDLVVSLDSCHNMVPGSDGIVTLKVSNVGGVCAGESVVYLIPSLPGIPQDASQSSGIILAPSLVLPVQSSQFLGRMDPGDERLVSFKVAVSPDADAGTYPLGALVSYTDAWGKQKSSNVDVFGVPVQPEMKFAVDESPLVIKCGTSREETLNLTNIGEGVANDAVVRMNALDPFVVSYDTAYLGDVQPGDSVNTTFGIKVKPDAVPTTYYVTMEVKYYDDKDDPHVTKIIRKAIVVTPPPTLWDNLAENWPLAAGVCALALLGLLYAAWSFRRGKKPPQALPAALIPEKK